MCRAGYVYVLKVRFNPTGTALVIPTPTSLVSITLVKIKDTVTTMKRLITLSLDFLLILVGERARRLSWAAAPKPCRVGLCVRKCLYR